ncbi:MAG: hypothetical protein LAO78_26165 [Acidobacteriia bacterium]|nr:hypothetical protein [Terriglobia bacterium]
MFEFGAGTLWGFPVITTAANPTPMKFGTLQDVSLDISGDVKQLYGQKQFPEAVARGKCKITGKSKFASINGKMLNDLFFGQTLSTGMTQTALDEVKTIAAGSATVTNSAQFVQDWGVRYTATGLPLTRVSSAPTVGQYSVSAGVYTFNVGDNGTNVVAISYTFTAAASGTSMKISNQLMGFAPTIQVLLETVYNNNQFNVLLYSVVASKLSFTTKQEDFIIPEFDFEAFANAAGQVIDIYSNE